MSAEQVEGATNGGQGEEEATGQFVQPGAEATGENGQAWIGGAEAGYTQYYYEQPATTGEAGVTSDTGSGGYGIVTFNIFVGDLKPEMTEEMIHAAFEPCGPIQSVNIVRDKTTQVPLGYGFVHFLTKDAQQKALIPPYSNQQIAGHTIRVNCSDGKNTLFVGNLPPDLREAEVRAEIEKIVGRPAHVELKTGPPPDYNSRGFAFATFSDKTNAEAAKRALIGKFIRGFQVNVKWAEIRRVTSESMASITTLYIGNLHKCVTQEQLKAYYMQWGNVVRVNIVKDPQGTPKGFAFITFDDRNDCVQALNHSNNAPFCGQPLVVTLATPNPENAVKRKEDQRRASGGGVMRMDPYARTYPPAPGRPLGSRGYWDQRGPAGRDRGYEHGVPPGYPDPYAHAYPGYPPPTAGYYPYPAGYPSAPHAGYPPAPPAYPSAAAGAPGHPPPTPSPAYPSAAPSPHAAYPTTYPTWNSATGTWS